MISCNVKLHQYNDKKCSCFRTKYLTNLIIKELLLQVECRKTDTIENLLTDQFIG